MNNQFAKVVIDANAPEPTHEIKMVNSRTGETWIDKTVEPGTPIPPRSELALDPAKIAVAQAAHLWIVQQFGSSNPTTVAAQRCGKKFGYINSYSLMTIIHIGKREYDTRRMTDASIKRLHKVLSSPAIETRVEFDKDDFSPTVYFWYGV